MQAQPYQPGTIEPERRPVIARQRRTVHLHRQDARVEIVARKYPARARHRRPGRRACLVDAGDQHADDAADGFARSTIAASGTPSQSAVLIRPKLVGSELPEHSIR